MADATTSPASPLLPSRKKPTAAQYARCASNPRDELRSFRACLRWLCVDHSTRARSAASWAAFLLLGVAAPLSLRLVAASSSSGAPPRPFDAQVQTSLTLAALLASACLGRLLGRAGGMRRLLYLDSLRRDSDDVQAGYAAQLDRSFRAYYYASSARSFRSPWWAAACCAVDVASWVYRAALFFMVCVLFRIICYLQILRMVGFAREFGRFADVAAVLVHHRRIREQLRKISHRYRKFIVCSLVLVSATQFAALLATTRPHATVDLATAGELAYEHIGTSVIMSPQVEKLTSLSLVAGLLMCLHSAAKITHKTQAITSVAAAWHADATVHAFDNDQENPDPDLPAVVGYLAPANAYRLATGDESGSDDDFDSRSESSLDDSKYVPFQANNICFQKRQALVTYFENNRAGITVYGFVVDRAWLHALFMIEFSLVMWLLGKTVGIS
ncbi:hypothetical protein PR202_gb08839 [Eleusine coracana subsp. coracana]|uniref:Uncharacterized protein n=1 Tax=Eleusine coracana subsp. coracana TaxID=191504 RepID=A0AAV5EGJ7_ELECO|nr:hypothetical protein PR202_gb08839 [Eleusine coracana subsp. coracana]